MNEYVADTVALILRLEKRTMGQQARQAFVDIERGAGRLYIPSMVFAEILYLAERKALWRPWPMWMAIYATIQHVLRRHLPLLLWPRRNRSTIFPNYMTG